MFPPVSEATQTTTANDLVTVTLLSDGREVSGAARLISLSVSKEANRIPSAKIILDDGDVAARDFPLSNTDDFIPGKTIEIKAGYHSDEETIFKGIVVKHGIKVRTGRPSVLEIECKDESVKMTLHRKSAYFLDSSDSDVMEQVIGEYGLDNDVESTSPTHPEVVQYQSTDWDFVLARAEANGMLAFPDDGTLNIAKPDPAQTASLNLSYGSSIVEFEAEMDARNQFDGVRSVAWDFANQELTDATASPAASSALGGLAPNAAAALSGEDGGSPLSTADLAAALGGETLTLYHGGDLDNEELTKWAEGRQLRIELARVRGRVKILGNSAIKPGQTVKLEGVGGRFNGSLFVSGICHQIYGGAWYTDIQLGYSTECFAEKYAMDDLRAGGLTPSIQGLHIGIVSKVEGDERAGDHRIQVRIPHVAEQNGAQSDGIYARLGTLHAGAERGFAFRPEIGDEVILGFVNNDPRDAIVLGSLHSNANAAPIPATDDNFEKGYYAKGKMKLAFNDDDKSILLKTDKGNSVLLSEKEGKVIITDENNNTITMSSSGISLESPGDIVLKATGSVKIEGANIEQKATATWKAQGNMAEINGSATTAVKGGIVNIN